MTLIAHLAHLSFPLPPLLERLAVRLSSFINKKLARLI